MKAKDVDEGINFVQRVKRSFTLQLSQTNQLSVIFNFAWSNHPEIDSKIIYSSWILWSVEMVWAETFARGAMFRHRPLLVTRSSQGKQAHAMGTRNPNNAELFNSVERQLKCFPIHTERKVSYRKQKKLFSVIGRSNRFFVNYPWVLRLCWWRWLHPRPLL